MKASVPTNYYNSDDYYKYAPYTGGRIVNRVKVNGAEQAWVPHALRHVNCRWLGPVQIRSQGVEFFVRYVGIHEHIKRGMYPMHTHPHSELVFTLEGQGEIRIPGRDRVEKCKVGRLVALPASLAHQSVWSVRPGDRPWRTMVVNFDLIMDIAQILLEPGDRVDFAFSPFNEWFYIHEREGIDITGPELTAVLHVFEEIEQSLVRHQYGTCSDIVAGLIRTISLFSRFIMKSNLADGTHVAPPVISKEAALFRARTLMEHGGVLDMGCVAKVARTIGMSESHFIREFKRVHGVTPMRYSLDVLMRRGAALMMNSDISVKDASFQLGYVEPSAFSRAFTRYHGLTPKSFQLKATAGQRKTKRKRKR